MNYQQFVSHHFSFESKSFKWYQTRLAFKRMPLYDFAMIHKNHKKKNVKAGRVENDIKKKAAPI